eukprot:3385541-Pleurochrysis_carterae.AAC.1
MLYSLIRLEKWADVDRVNALIASYNWPVGQRPPNIHASVTKGAVHGNVPYPSGHLRYTASQMLHFNAHSVERLRSVIEDASRPFWQCWLAH